jgi:hypothetical protein
MPPLSHIQLKKYIYHKEGKKGRVDHGPCSQSSIMDNILNRQIPSTYAEVQTGQHDDTLD